MKKHFNKQTGFTLIELVLVIIIIGIIVSIGSTLVFHAFRASHQSSKFIESTWQTRLSLRRMTKEIQSIRSTEDLITPLSPLIIAFKNTDGNIVSYFRLQTLLMRNISRIAKNISDLHFTYLDENNEITFNPSDVRCIEIKLTLMQNNAAIPLETLVCPRNFL